MEDNEQVTNDATRVGYTKTLAGISGVVACLLGFIFFTRNPGQGGPMLILGVLLLFFCIFVCSVVIVLSTLDRLFSKRPLSRIRLLYTSVAVASGLIFLLGLQTLGQLQLIDLVLVLVFELLLNFYLLRRF